MLDKPWYFVLSGVCMALVVATTLLGLLFLAVRYL